MPDLLSQVTSREWIGADARSLALFRIVIGTDLLYELIGRSVFLAAHYTDAGVLPRAIMPALSRRLILPIFRFSGELSVQVLLFLAAGLFAAMLMVGYRTRLATVLTWIMHLALIDRNPLIAGAGDNLMKFLLFWSMFVPLGECWSVDSLRARSSNTRQAQSERPGHSIVTWGVLALLLQIASVYLFAGLFKLQAPAWRDGSAIERAMQIYTRCTPFGIWLLDHPHFLSLNTYLIPWIQVVGALLLFAPFWNGPLRTLLFMIFTAFQFGLGACMVLGNFQQVAALMLIPFLPGWLWNKLARQNEGSSAAVAPESTAIGMFPSTTRSAPIIQRVAETIAATLALYSFAMNLGGLLFNGTLPGRPERLASFLSIDQRWELFSNPEMERVFGWVIVPARLADGRVVDLLTGSADIHWESPPPFALPKFVNWRGRAYLGAYTKFAEHDPKKATYPQFLRTEWDRSHPDTERIQDFQIIFITDSRTRDGHLRGVEPIVLWPETGKITPRPNNSVPYESGPRQDRN